MFAPSAEAVNKSRMNPKTLESKIPELLVNIALNIGFFNNKIVDLHNFNKGLVKIRVYKI